MNFPFNSNRRSLHYAAPPLIPQSSPIWDSTQNNCNEEGQRNRDRTHWREGEEPPQAPLPVGVGRKSQPAFEELLRAETQPLLLRRRRAAPPPVPAAAAASPSPASSSRRPAPAAHARELAGVRGAATREGRLAGRVAAWLLPLHDGEGDQGTLDLGSFWNGKWAPRTEGGEAFSRAVSGWLRGSFLLAFLLFLLFWAQNRPGGLEPVALGLWAPRFFHFYI